MIDINSKRQQIINMYENTMNMNPGLKQGPFRVFESDRGWGSFGGGSYSAFMYVYIGTHNVDVDEDLVKYLEHELNYNLYAALHPLTDQKRTKRI